MNAAHLPAAGGHPGDDLGRDAIPVSRPGDAPDALDLVLARLKSLESPAMRNLVAEVASDLLSALTRTIAVATPLPDTPAGSPQEALAVLAGLDQFGASLTAVESVWQIAAEERMREADRQRGVARSQQGRAAAKEIALARRTSSHSSSISLASARRLVTHMPRVFSALQDGVLTQRQTAIITSSLKNADEDTCIAIDEHFGAAPHLLAGKGTQKVADLVTEQIQKLAPGDSRGRAERAARQRHVTMRPLTDGMARVSATLRAVDAVAMMNSLRQQAQAERAAGTKDSVSAIEADLLVNAVVTHDPHAAAAATAAATAAVAAVDDAQRPLQRPRIDVGIVITDHALLSPADDTQTAHLNGYGTLPAHIVTDTLLGNPPGSVQGPEPQHPDTEVEAVFRRLYAAPTVGELTAMESRARAFPVGLARMIRWRDQTCRTPWCNAVIRHTDHVEPHHRNGPTSYDNGQGLCVRCNLLKEHGAWTITPLGDAPATEPAATGKQWTSPHGATGISRTPRIIPPPVRREGNVAAEPAPGPATGPLAEPAPGPAAEPTPEPRSRRGRSTPPEPPPGPPPAGPDRPG